MQPLRRPRPLLAAWLAVAVLAASCTTDGETTTEGHELPPIALPTTQESARPEPLPDRLGSFVTRADLEMWRERAATGPFADWGDHSPNSPGEFTEIEERARTFHADPSANRWRGPLHNNTFGPVLQDRSTDSDPPVSSYADLTAAAFHSLVADDATGRSIVANELLATMQEADLQFADRSRWAPGIMDDVNPLFMIADWASSHLLAMDYVEAGDPEIFTPAQRRALLQWFHALADLVHEDVERTMSGSVFSDWDERKEPPFTPYPDLLVDDDLDLAHDEAGRTITDLSKQFNNRRAQMVRFVGMVGLRLASENVVSIPADADWPSAQQLLDQAHKFFTGFVAYGTYPEGYTAEIARGSQGASFGWSYTWGQLAPVMTFAHLAAERGDTRLLDYQTSLGVQSTLPGDGDPPKSLDRTIRVMAGWTQSVQVRRTWRGEPIDGLDIRGAEGYHDLGTLAAWLSHREDPTVRAVLERDPEAGYSGFKETRVTSYRNPQARFAHDWHIFPGSLFYFRGAPGSGPVP